MKRHTGQGQGEQHDNLQDLTGVENPALVYLGVRHILQDRAEVKQQEDIESGEYPQEDSH